VLPLIASSSMWKSVVLSRAVATAPLLMFLGLLSCSGAAEREPADVVEPRDEVVADVSGRDADDGGEASDAADTADTADTTDAEHADVAMDVSAATDAADVVDAALEPVSDHSFAFGLSTHLSTSAPHRRRQELELNRQAGVELLRRDFHWHVIEPEDDRFEFDAYDTIVDEAAEQGQSFIGLLVYGVGWAMEESNHSSIDPADFADYVFHTVEHFRGRVSRWEVWNEQNWVRFWEPKPDPAAYGSLLKAAYEAAKRADPECTVAFGGLAPSDFLFGEHWKFLEDVYAAHPDIGEHFDALAIHPYTMFQQPSPEQETRGGSVPALVRYARLILHRHGDGDKAIWISELGWPACPCPPVEPPAAPVPNVSYEEQARYLVRSFVLAISEGAEVLLWYTFRDGAGGASPSSESYFGLVQYDADPAAEPGPEPKPAYHAYATMTAMLGGQIFRADLREDLVLAESEYAFRFTDEQGKRWVDVLWSASAGDGVDVEIPVGDATSVAVRDMMGAALTADPEAGRITLKLTGDPVYLIRE